jgi:hypothetical protein
MERCQVMFFIELLELAFGLPIYVYPPKREGGDFFLVKTGRLMEGFAPPEGGAK